MNVKLVPVADRAALVAFVNNHYASELPLDDGAFAATTAMLFIKLKEGFLAEGMHTDHEKPGLHEYSLGKLLR